MAEEQPLVVEEVSTVSIISIIIIIFQFCLFFGTKQDRRPRSTNNNN